MTGSTDDDSWGYRVASFSGRRDGRIWIPANPGKYSALRSTRRTYMLARFPGSREGPPLGALYSGPAVDGAMGRSNATHGTLYLRTLAPPSGLTSCLGRVPLVPQKKHNPALSIPVFNGGARESGSAVSPRRPCTNLARSRRLTVPLSASRENPVSPPDCARSVLRFAWWNERKRSSCSTKAIVQRRKASCNPRLWPHATQGYEQEGGGYFVTVRTHMCSTRLSHVSHCTSVRSAPVSAVSHSPVPQIAACAWPSWPCRPAAAGCKLSTTRRGDLCTKYLRLVVHVENEGPAPTSIS